MGMHRMRKAALAGFAALVATFAIAPAADASYHVMKIREIAGDVTGTPGDQSYIELQMYDSGQNFVAGHKITLWDEDATQLSCNSGNDPCPIAEFTLTGANPSNGGNQRTVLIGDTGVANADFTISTLDLFLENQAGQDLVEAGAACFEAIPVDCVSWGGSNFVGQAKLPDQTAPIGSAMTAGVLAFQRKISGGSCSTALDTGDDTNNAANDFATVGADPTPNSTAPTETLCPANPPTGGPGPNTFNLAAAIKKCKKKFPKGPQRKKCIRKAKQKAASLS